MLLLNGPRQFGDESDHVRIALLIDELLVTLVLETVPQHLNEDLP